MLFDQENAYSQSENNGVFKSIQEGVIELTSYGYDKLKKMKKYIAAGTTKLMNHYEGGTYAIGGTYSGL